MVEEDKKENSQQAKIKADVIEGEILHALQSGKSLLVEAGAGAGKTYSLNRVIDWLQTNKWEDFKKKKQQVACVTYTNAAVEVIKRRLKNDSFIVPSTIHSFAWRAICQYQNALKQIISSEGSFKTERTDGSDVYRIEYTLGHRYIEQGIYYLYHDDVLKLFCRLLDMPKFRQIFADKYPIILIDEYQDSNKDVVDRFLTHFISKTTGPQFAFFGDAWQTIYKSSNACGKIEHSNLTVIEKKSNFRSAPQIVEVLNKLRPKLRQIPAKDNLEGEVVVITCDDYKGVRQTNGYYKDDLNTEEFTERIRNLQEKICATTQDKAQPKTLMITHKMLAKHQGYDELLNILDEGLKKREDPILLFFIDIVEPIFHSLQTSNSRLLFDTLGTNRYPITHKSQKKEWKLLYNKLITTREAKAIDVFECIDNSNLVPIPPKVRELYNQFIQEPDKSYTKNGTFRAIFNLNYSQFIAARSFLSPDAIFSTEHGVKGEEYDNVLFVISRGWKLYSFDKYAPMMLSPDTDVSENDREAYERNRNLFYVCCSRPVKRLFIFVSIPVNSDFRNFLTYLVGNENILTYEEFMERE